jgi:hypothetical protein
MRNISKALLVAVGLLSIGIFSSSSVSANSELVGSFTLARPIQWKNTMLPAGNYTFRLARTQTDSNLLKVRGEKRALDIMVFAQSACETCKSGALNLAMRGGNRVVTSLELPGFHVDFNGSQSPAESERQMGKVSTPAEQVAVHVDSN